MCVLSIQSMRATFGSYTLAAFTRSFGGNTQRASNIATKKCRKIFWTRSFHTGSEEMLGTNHLKKLTSKGLSSNNNRFSCFYCKIRKKILQIERLQSDHSNLGIGFAIKFYQCHCEKNVSTRYVLMYFSNMVMFTL